MTLSKAETDKKIKELKASRQTEKNNYKELTDKMERLVDEFVANERLPHGSIFELDNNPVNVFNRSGIAVGLSDKEVNIAKHYYKSEWLIFPPKK